MIDTDYERTMDETSTGSVCQISEMEYEMIAEYVNYLKGGTRPANYEITIKLIINKLESLL